MSPHVPNIDQLGCGRDVSKSGGDILASKALRPKCANQRVGGFSLGPPHLLPPVGFAPNPSRRAEKEEGWIRASDAPRTIPKTMARLVTSIPGSENVC